MPSDGLRLDFVQSLKHLLGPVGLDGFLVLVPLGGQDMAVPVTGRDVRRGLTGVEDRGDNGADRGGGQGQDVSFHKW